MVTRISGYKVNILSRSIAAAATLCLVAPVLVSSPAASAAQPGRPGLPVLGGQAPVTISRGLIVMTRATRPSAAILRAADTALGSDASVAGSDALAGKISTVAFDETVPTEVAAKAAADLEKRSDVVWAVPDTLRHVTAASPVVVDDTYFAQQRNLWDAVASPVGGYSIKAPSLWRKTQGSPGVVVAVVDTGVREEHPDLAGQLVPGYDMIDMKAGASDPGDGTIAGQCPNEPDGTPTPAEPSSWHGTFVAGEIAAKADNGSFIAGSAPGVRVQPVRVLGPCGGWDSNVLAGITWASGGHVAGVPDNPTPAKVVNLSLGSSRATLAQRNYSCTAYAAVAAAGRARGTVFVAAAGNDGGNANLGVPASCPGYVSVAATSAKGFSSSYSSIGTSVDLSAPGGDTLVEGPDDSIISLLNLGSLGPIVGGSTAGRYEGTSMAAPEVSAGAALLYSLGLTTATQVENALFASVAPFRAKSKAYANKAVRVGGRTYYFDLNCAGHSWCGRGILDLSRVQTSLTAPTLGIPIVGEPLGVNVGTWVSMPPTFTYVWRRDGFQIPGQTGSTYVVKPDDVGHALSVRLAPGSAAFSPFVSTSADTAPVQGGPSVMLNIAAKARYGVAGSADVTLTNGSGTVDGPVELRRGSTVLASGTTVNGTVHLVIPGTMWIGGTNNVRAAFLGNGTDAAASTSPQPVTVAKASSTITTAVPSSARTSTHAAVRVAVKVAGVADPLGAFVVYDGTRKILGGSFTSTGRGVRTVSLPRLAKGKHHIKVVYAGNANIIGKTSSTRVLTVR